MSVANLMTSEQKFVFDLKGWFLIPGVLEADEIKETKEFLDALQNSPDSLPDGQRNVCAGPCSKLLDHPTVVGVLSEVIGNRLRAPSEDENASNNILPNQESAGPTEGPKAYSFRCDAFHLVHRTYNPAHNPSQMPPSPPHNGGLEMFPTHSFHVLNGNISSPVTRVVWELNPVRKGMGGTLFMSGSHKNNFHIPPDHRQIESPLYETYECPAGSVLFFTEAICHGGPHWLDSENDRMAIFFHYLHASAKWHRQGPNSGAPPHETVMAMPPKRRTLFRGVWIGVGQKNEEYSEQNRAV